MKHALAPSRRRRRDRTIAGPGPMSPEVAANWRWMHEHAKEIYRGREGNWAAIGMCRLLAWGKDPRDVERRAQCLAGSRPILLRFLEPTDAFYSHPALPKSRLD